LFSPYFFESDFILNIIPVLIALTGVFLFAIRFIPYLDSGRFSFVNSPWGLAIWILISFGNGDGNFVVMVYLVVCCI